MNLEISFLYFLKLLVNIKIQLIFIQPFPFFLFGLNEVSVRSVSVFFSILSMMVLFFIGKRIKNNYLGLILMFVYAITPWSIHISRMNLEGMNHLIFFMLLGIFFLNEFYKTNKTLFLFSSYIFFGLATYSYFPGRITIPLFIFINTILLFLKNKSKYKVFLPSLVYFLIIIPLIFHILLGNGLARWQQVSIFNVHNINPWQKIIKSYLLHFSPDFLFLKEDIGMIGQFITRHSIKDFGEFYLWQAPFILLSIFYLIKKRRRIFYSIITILLIYPLSSALTTDVFPQATRSIIGIIPFTLFTGAGLIYFSNINNYFYEFL
ncbi:MAG: glycosyltransferase family 39 protein [Candidatus Roizmanbacteria bacterium]|nr:glycosyltransferase family 39 protein [Candidatus Roizmanbacteria bacterium]